MRSGLVCRRRRESSSSASSWRSKYATSAARCAWRSAAIADRVDRQADRVGEPEVAPQPREQDHLLGVDVRPGEAQRLDVELVELAVAALLRALVAEHRPGEPHPLRPLVAEVVLDRRAHDARGRFRPQRQALAGELVVERVHLLLDDVGHRADRAHEERRLLDDRHAQVAIAVEREHAAHRILEALPQRRLVGQHVVHAAHRLQAAGLRLRAQPGQFDRGVRRAHHAAFTAIVRRSGSSARERGSPP